MDYFEIYIDDPQSAPLPSEAKFWTLKRGAMQLNNSDVFDELIKLTHSDVTVGQDSVCVPMEAVELMWKYIAMGGYGGLTLAEFINRMMADKAPELKCL